MTAQQEYATHIVHLLEGSGHCEARRMFGSYGIFHQGLMSGLIAAGGSAFGYFRKEREYQLSCYRAPDEFFEDSDACRLWSRIAFDAALRNPGKRKRRKS
jgi:DNA transformation protein